jgi:ferritin-like metal-binding protein YciE
MAANKPGTGTGPKGGFADRPVDVSDLLDRAPVVKLGSLDAKRKTQVAALFAAKGLGTPAPSRGSGPHRVKPPTAGEQTTREAKLIQYLNEAYNKERELETALKAHISMTSRDAYKKRLRAHLKETSQQAKGLRRRIKALGGKTEPVSRFGPETQMASAIRQSAWFAQDPMQAIRETGQAEKLLKNAKTELFNEFEEIANYLAIEELANGLYDRDTAKLAREFRRQEERMAKYLQKLIPQLAKQVVREEIPAKERKPAAEKSPARSATRGHSRPAARSASNRPSSSSSVRGKPATSPAAHAKKTNARTLSTSARAKQPSRAKKT